MDVGSKRGDEVRSGMCCVACGGSMCRCAEPQFAAHHRAEADKLRAELAEAKAEVERLRDGGLSKSQFKRLSVQLAPRWIPVSERYPEMNTRVLVYNEPENKTWAESYGMPYYHITKCKMQGKSPGWGDSLYGVFGPTEPVWWMPLPPAPEGE